MELKDKKGLTIIYEGELLIKGAENSQKAGFQLQVHAVLIYDGDNNEGMVLCFKTHSHWTTFKKKYEKEFSGEKVTDWNVIQCDTLIEAIVRLQDAKFKTTALKNRERSEDVTFQLYVKKKMMRMIY